MDNGLSVLIGVIWAIIALGVIALSMGWSIATVKDGYVQTGFMDHKGQIYSVRPAKIRLDPVQ